MKYISEAVHKQHSIWLQDTRGSHFACVYLKGSIFQALRFFGLSCSEIFNDSETEGFTPGLPCSHLVGLCV